jgi:allantoate deiminase
MSPSLGVRVMALVDALAQYTDEPGRLTRLYLSPAHRATAEAALAMMHDAGLDARMDAVGNVTGRYEGREPGAPALILGSHLDSVVDAGRFDGPLGVACGIVAVEVLTKEGPLPFAVEVVAFGDEENVRFPTSLSTSAALAGRRNARVAKRSSTRRAASSAGVLSSGRATKMRARAAESRAA